MVIGTETITEKRFFSTAVASIYMPVLNHKQVQLNNLYILYDPCKTVKDHKISFDDINNNFCTSTGVTYEDRDFYMTIIKDGWFKIKHKDQIGWIYSESLKADYYGVSSEAISPVKSQFKITAILRNTTGMTV